MCKVLDSDLIPWIIKLANQRAIISLLTLLSLEKYATGEDNDWSFNEPFLLHSNIKSVNE